MLVGEVVACLLDHELYLVEDFPRQVLGVKHMKLYDTLVSLRIAEERQDLLPGVLLSVEALEQDNHDSHHRLNDLWRTLGVNFH